MIKCKAKLNNGTSSFQGDKGNIYISALGYVTPCCWMGSHYELGRLWAMSKIDKKSHNIAFHSIEEIIEGDMWKWIDDNMEANVLCIQKLSLIHI